MTHEMLEFICCLSTEGACSMVIGGYTLAFLQGFFLRAATWDFQRKI